ncbi:MAG TPA: hypothetical protein VH164_15605 [Ktedonobacteraceae bacterium]|nr:hypothetical protein [Ktedonobacteraceae bacterium]
MPDPVVAHLQAGNCLAPTLLEIAEPDGICYAVLDLILEVPVPPQPDLKRVQRVLGWDWGVRTLVTATVVDLSGNRLSPPLFLDTGGLDGRQAHTRRHIDRLKKKVAKLEARRDRFPNSPGHGVGSRADCRGIPQIAQVGRPGALSQRKVGALAE